LLITDNLLYKTSVVASIKFLAELGILNVENEQIDKKVLLWTI